MATYQEQIARNKALKKAKLIEQIFEDIREGKYFGPEALSRAYDAGAEEAKGVTQPEAASLSSVERLIASWSRETPLTSISCNFAAALLRDALHPTGSTTPQKDKS